jgi:GT2 family glycosyltransferase
MKTDARTCQVPDTRSLGIKGPVVSVIIPTYNRASLIGRAIQSVIDQTYQDLEIIVVDDGSTDGTGDILRRYDERIRSFRHPQKKGAGSARNTGIRQAKGQYLAFLDSDDEWLEKKLETQIEAFRTASPMVGVVYTGTWRVKGEKRWLIPNPAEVPGDGALRGSLLSGTYMVLTPAALVKKECFEALGGFDERLTALEEWDLWIRLSKRYRFLYVDEPLVIWHSVPGSLSTNRKAFLVSTIKILEKNTSEILRKPGVLLRHLFRLMRLGVGHILHQGGFRG